MAGDPAGIDPVRGHEQVRIHAQVGGRITERSPAGVAGDDGAVDLGRAAEQPRRALEVAFRQQRADRRRRDAREEVDAPDREAELLEGA